MMPTMVRSCHPYAFRSGEWARVITTDEAYGRACWLVAFDDGATDTWVVNDPSGEYEFVWPAS